jgi:hypothetical protein
MPATYEPIASTTLGSSATNVEFTGIASTYTDLILVVAIKPTNTTNPALLMQVGNGSFDTGSNYSITGLYGSGSAATSGRLSSQTTINFARESGIGNATTQVFTGVFQLMSYSNTNVFKTILEASGVASNGVARSVALWRSTSAIDRVKVYVSAGGFDTGSMFSLYAIKASA